MPSLFGRYSMRRIALPLFILLTITACGKKAALIYPEMLAPATPATFSARQFGNSMKLSFVLPRKDRAGRSLKGLSGVRILKREAIAGQGPECGACTADFNLFRTLYLDVPGETQRYGDLLVLLDGDVRVGREYTYKVVTFTKDGVDGEATAPVLTAVVQPPQPPVLQLHPSPTEMLLEIGGKAPVETTFVGYNLYRAGKGEAMPLLPLTREPVAMNSFTDTGLDRREVYTYTARTVVRMPSGGLVESGPSNAVEGALKEDE